MIALTTPLLYYRGASYSFEGPGGKLERTTHPGLLEKVLVDYHKRQVRGSVRYDERRTTIYAGVETVRDSKGTECLWLSFADEKLTVAHRCRSCGKIKPIIEDDLCEDCWLGCEFLCSQLGCTEKDLKEKTEETHDPARNSNQK